MQIRQITIRNFRSINSDGVTLELGDVTSLVGENNCGKSNILQALDLFFHPTTKINEDYFYNRDTSTPIEIQVVFDELTDRDRERFASYITNNTLAITRRFVFNPDKKIGSSFEVVHIASVAHPEPEWLDEEHVNRKNIDKWIESREQLVVAGIPFIYGQETEKPKVEEWKTAAEEFLSQNTGIVPMIAEEKENPKGFSSVLSSGLPNLVFVVAVRDVTDETKVTQSNPFGTVIHWMLERISGDIQSEVGNHLDELKKLFNRGDDGSRRAQEIDLLENKLSEALAGQFDVDVELEIGVPEIDELFFRGINIQVDDGFRTPLGIKGHGLQRAFIFALFRTYVAEQNAREEQQKDSIEEDQSRCARPCIFAFEEPELYLHPQIQRATMNLFRRVGSGPDQVIFSTHSPAFVDIGRFDDIVIVRKVKLSSGTNDIAIVEKAPFPPYTVAIQVSVQRFVDNNKVRYPTTNPTQDSIRERYMHLYDVRRNEAFFARKAVLVEGPTEEYILPIYAQALGIDFDKEAISVIMADGKGSLYKLLWLYNEFRIPCYVLFDGDKGNSDKGCVRESKNLLAMFGEERAEEQFETLITDRFCMIEIDMESILKSEIPDYNELYQEAIDYLGSCGKPLPARYIAKRLLERGTQEGDPAKYVPPTIKKIMDRIVEVTWQGSLLATVETEHSTNTI
ncbi:MAG: ATP-dependent endonuclease [Anaerolineae bacterium]|nr:ATP-dependent endonuclease [Anaerolineae bacterium]